MQEKELNDFLEESTPLLDVRSPIEYASGHIPGAISFPLFEDEERSKIGTIYKKKSREDAIKEGLDIVGPKMRRFIEDAEKLESKQLRLYCWRGGMRSGSLGWLLQQYGFEVTLLKGGYKSYRRGIQQYFSQDIPLVVLTGYTGCGKTEILHSLKKLEEQVIDLEELAQHQGSSFGNQMSQSQPTSEQFQNNLFWKCRKLDLKRRIWVEDESICIGQVSLPESLFHAMSESPHIWVNLSKTKRIASLVDSYGKLGKEKLKVATREIQKKLGPRETKEAVEMIEAECFAPAADIILEYYDRQYRKAIEKKMELVAAKIHMESEDFDTFAQRIINAYEYQVN